MKKLILISSLLAAGTMMANAATLVAQWNNFNDLTSDLSELTNPTTGETLTFSVSNVTTSGSSYANGVLAVSNASAGATYANRLCVDLTSANLSGANGGFTVVMDINTFSNVANNVIADMVGGSTKTAGNEGAYGFGRGNTQNVYWRINNSGTFSTISGKDYISGGSTAPSTNPGTIVFTFASSGEMRMYVGGTLVHAITATPATEASEGVAAVPGYSSSEAFTKLVLGGYGDSTVSSSQNDRANSTYNLTKMAIYSGVLSTDDITSGNVYIPEPSMFGLLAGTLALGLAGTRRRRK